MKTDKEKYNLPDDRIRPSFTPDPMPNDNNDFRLEFYMYYVKFFLLGFTVIGLIFGLAKWMIS